MTPPRAFGGLDWSVLAAYTAALFGVTFYFSHRQRTTKEFFTGDRRASPFIAGISIITATTSIITYIGNPGEYVQYGPALTFYAPLVTLPFLYFTVGWLLIPFIMRLRITSAYELLEGRLGRSVRLTGSIVYVVSRFVWTAVILYVAATVLVDVVGYDRHWVTVATVIIGVVTTAYTLFGGIRTLMITGMMQYFLLLLGAVVVIVSISVSLGGVGAWWPTHWEKHWEPQPFFSSDPHLRVTQVGAFLYYVVTCICVAGSDQAAIQRFLTTHDTRSARRAYLLTNLATGLIAVVLGLVGAALIGFYRSRASSIPDLAGFAQNGDAFFPHYISHFLPAGVSGLLVACVMASAIACLAATINSTITVVVTDFIGPARSAAHRTEAQKLRLTRLLAVGFGAVMILCSVAVGFVEGDIVEIATKTANLLIAPLFGLFFLAIFVPFATPFGAIVSAFAGTAAGVLAAYWDVFTGTPKISFCWMTPISLAAGVAAGCLFSLLPTRGRPPAVVWAYAIATTVLLGAMFGGVIAWGR